MPTSRQFQEAKKIEQELGQRGYHLKLNTTTPPKAQWYRQDGTPLPNLLPTDVHHRDMYHANGWSLIPPRDEDIVPMPRRVVGAQGGDFELSETTSMTTGILEFDEEVTSYTETSTFGLTLPQGISVEEAEAVLAAYYAKKEDIVAPVVQPHRHKYDKPIGSSCRTEGCMAVRQRPGHGEKRKAKNRKRKKTEGVTIAEPSVASYPIGNDGIN